MDDRPFDAAAAGCRSAEETRLIEVLLTHNEPVSCEDLACVLRLQRAEVRALAIGLQAQGFAVVDVNNDTIEATPSTDAALRN